MLKLQMCITTSKLGLKYKMKALLMNIWKSNRKEAGLINEAITTSPNTTDIRQNGV